MASLLSCRLLARSYFHYNEIIKEIYISILYYLLKKLKNEQLLNKPGQDVIWPNLLRSYKMNL